MCEPYLIFTSLHSKTSFVRIKLQNKIVLPVDLLEITKQTVAFSRKYFCTRHSVLTLPTYPIYTNFAHAYTSTHAFVYWKLTVMDRMCKIWEVQEAHADPGGSSLVSAFASGARGPRFDPRSRRGNFGVRTRFPWCHLQGY